MLLTQQVSADDLLNILGLKSRSRYEKLEAISVFKTVVKRAYIDMSEVDGYFEALFLGEKDTDAEIRSSSFNTLCHLVRRVGMQDEHGRVLLEKSKIVLPIILLRLNLSKESNKRAACKILETYWLCTPHTVEQELLSTIEISSTGDGLALLHAISFLVTSLGAKFPLHIFFQSLIKMLGNNSETYEVPISEILRLYFLLEPGRTEDFIRSLETNVVPAYYKDKFLSKCISNYAPARSLAHTSAVSKKSEISSQQVGTHNSKVSSLLTRQNSNGRINSFKTLRDAYLYSSNSETKSHVNASALYSRLNSVSSSMSNRSNSPDVPGTEHSVSDDLKAFVPEQTYTISSSIDPIDVALADDLQRTLHELAPCFDGKETERNWQSREKAITRWRGLIRGNGSAFTMDLVQIFANDAEGVCKGIRSLRTSLSNHSCYLLKELAIIFKDDFDSIYDAFIPTLLKQCAATKNITTTNANHTMCAIFMNCAFSNKFLSRIQTASLDKNVNPRSYSGLWLRIFLTRFHNHPGFLNQHGQNSVTGVELTEKIVTKLLKDPNPLVRTSGKECFWTFCHYFSAQADELLSTLDSNIVKAIGRSRDSAARELPSINSHMNKGSQHSMKEIIAAKRKEARSASPLYATSGYSKTTTTRSLTMPSTSQPSRLEALKLVSAKLGPPRRVPQISSPIALQHPQSTTGFLDSEPAHITSLSTQLSVDANKPKILEEHTKVNEILFEKESDPILKFLASNDEELIKEGISLLKFAIKGNEDLSNELNGLLAVISVKSAELLRPLFCDSDVVLERCSHFFCSQDYLRICCLLINPLASNHIEAISKAFDVSELFRGVQHLFNMLVSYIDMEDGDLVIQIIAFKSVIATSLIQMLNALLERFPVTDEQFRGLSSVLIKFQGFISDTDIYPSYSNLIVLLKTINQKILREELDKASSTERSNIEDFLGNTPSSARDLANMLEDITRVNVPSMISDLSPVKVTELTKILVPNSVHLEETNPHIDRMSKNAERENMDVEQDRSINLIGKLIDTSERVNQSQIVIEEQMIDVDKDEDLSMIEGLNYKLSFNENHENFVQVTNDTNIVIPDDLSLKSNIPSDNDRGFEDHPDLVEDFTKVHISPLKVHSSRSLSPSKPSPLENFIERVDPLNKLANRNKPIPIFEDSDSTVSIQEAKQHSFTDLKWYNLQMAKLTFNSFALDEIEKNDLNVERFKTLCDAMLTKSISGKQILILLNYLQDTNTLSDFGEYFRASGKSQLAKSLFKFLESPRELPMSKIQSGLIVIKLLLINRCAIDLEQLWNILLILAMRCKSAYCELAIGLHEVFDEMLVNAYDEKELSKCLVLSISTAKHNDFATIFILESLSKIIDSESFRKRLSASSIVSVDLALRQYLSHSMVDIRRITIVLYARLLRLAMALGEHGDLDAQGAMNAILPQFTFTERKLVEYYSN